MIDERDPHDSRDLETEIGQALEQLPVRRAPATLLPRVMAAVARAESMPWYRRGWSAWPREWQLASATMFALVVAGVWLALRFGVTVNPDSPSVVWTLRITTLSRVVWQVFVQPIVLYFAALALAGSLACAMLWSAANRLALGGASTR